MRSSGLQATEFCFLKKKAIQDRFAVLDCLAVALGGPEPGATVYQKKP